MKVVKNRDCERGNFGMEMKMRACTMLKTALMVFPAFQFCHRNILLLQIKANHHSLHAIVIAFSIAKAFVSC